jgi:predicted phosphodiesterase
LSDLHIGKVVKDENDVEIYNTEIALRYVDQLTEKLFKVVWHIKRSSKVNEVVVLLLGDIVDNEQIYDTQPYHIDSFVVEQVKNASSVLWKLLLSLEKSFGKVRVCTVRGNHGRSGGHEESNWDKIVYQQLELLAELNGRSIVVENNYGEFNHCWIRGKKVMLRHYAPKQDGTAAARGRLGGWYQIHKFDALAFGHFHQVGLLNFNGIPLFRNGSLCPGDDYAERLALNDGPGQIIFGVSKKRLPTFFYVLDFK